MGKSIQLNKPINGKIRIIRNVIQCDGENFEGHYYGWHIHIYPMWGKLVNGQYRDDLKTGELGVDVSGPDGGRIVEAITGTFDEALKMAVENILSCRPRYGEK